MVEITSSESFRRKYSKLTRRNPELKSRISRQLKKFEQDPRYPGLHSHSVNSLVGEAFSIRITGDIRIIYVYENGVVELIDIGTHDEV